MPQDTHRVVETPRRTDAVIIGGGQAGLAMSHCLAAEGVDHVVLERGKVAQRWRGHWDSLRLLTPNWLTRLPGFGYLGPTPDGFMHKREVVSFLEHYAHDSAAPVSRYTSVRSVRQAADGRFLVTTSRGAWSCRSVVIATGNCGKAFVPKLASGISGTIQQLSLTSYKNPGQLANGGVLIVGASASGVQLAREIHASGRPVTLSVGSHTRIPRRYRGRDITYWMDVAGVSRDPADAARNLAASRRGASLQLIGSADGQSLDLGVLSQAGVRLVGRTTAARDSTLRFEPQLQESVRAADVKLERLLARIDEYIERHEPAPAREAIPKIDLDPGPATLDLQREGICTVVWATGYTRSYPWLQLPVLDERGQLVHDLGLTPVPGVYALGLNFMRRRNSSFIDGVGRDAEDLTRCLLAQLRGTTIHGTRATPSATRLVA